MARVKWTMPDWMEVYRGDFNNTGGNTVEYLMNGHTAMQINAPLAFLEMAVEAQVGMLYQLKKAGKLRINNPGTPLREQLTKLFTFGKCDAELIADIEDIFESQIYEKPPTSFPVTDDRLDAPDGAEISITYRRVGSSWEQVSDV